MFRAILFAQSYESWPYTHTGTCTIRKRNGQLDQFNISHFAQVHSDLKNIEVISKITFKTTGKQYYIHSTAPDQDTISSAVVYSSIGELWEKFDRNDENSNDEAWIRNFADIFNKIMNSVCPDTVEQSETFFSTLFEKIK